jgi:Copper type II ascorbate-dependent monooxygenase, C-terminal domain/Copper type II ascorbate-dependent monooxygenase, N-terminal domain
MNRLTLVVVVAFVTVACGGRPADSGGGQSNTSPNSTSGVTWYRDVLPLVQNNCQSCHLAGGIAPFALDTYESAFLRHAMIASSVAARHMPPWPADDNCVAVKGSRRLSHAEVDVFVQWSAAGAPAGNPEDAPAAPAPAAGLPSIDATLQPEFPYLPNGSVTDDYHCFVLPPAFAAQKDLIGFEVLPGSPHQVHHVILFAASQSAANSLNQDGLGWTCYGGSGIAQARMLGGWAPGGGVTRFPEDTGIRIAAGEVIVMQVHYNTSHGTPVADRTRVNLQFAPQPVAYPATIMPIVDNTFSIGPGQMNYTHGASVFLFPWLISTATLWGITPHMHEKGRRIRVWREASATSPETCLIDVPNWDFHWQQSYEYVAPIQVRGGDTIHIECTWDNPTTSTVTWGEGTADEMCIAFVYATAP